MNEKIKNLFNICGMPNEDIMELFEDKNKTFYMEKFAKLIIQECINEVSQYHSTTIYDGFIPENTTREHYEEWAYIKGSNTGYNDAVSQITDGLKQHFGIE